MKKFEEIKFGLLSEEEIYFLKNKLIYELEQRERSPEEYYEVVRADDGSEGFYCKTEDFGRINSEELHEQIALTLSQGSSILFSIEKIEKNNYDESCKQYEWHFDDSDTEPNTAINEEDDE